MNPSKAASPSPSSVTEHRRAEAQHHGHDHDHDSDAIFVSTVPSPLGTLLLYSDRKGLVALDFPGADVMEGSVRTALESREPLKRAAAALAAYFQEGKPLPRTLKSRLDGTDFQRKVWAAIEAIPLGKTKTYGEIALLIGHPGASRAVGAACGANPLPLFIPCHRVLASNGRLGGFTGGLDVKRRLLKLEGIDAF